MDLTMAMTTVTVEIMIMNMVKTLINTRSLTLVMHMFVVLAVAWVKNMVMTIARLCPLELMHSNERGAPHPSNLEAIQEQPPPSPFGLWRQQFPGNQQSIFGA